MYMYAMLELRSNALMTWHTGTKRNMYRDIQRNGEFSQHVGFQYLNGSVIRKHDMPDSLG